MNSARPPGGEKMFRVKGGNDRIASKLAGLLGRRLHLQTILRRVRQTASGIVAHVESQSGLAELAADYLICAMPATTARDVIFDPGMPDLQRDAIHSLRYGAVTKTALQFDRVTWRKRGKPRAFGTNLPLGAVWDGNEEQHGKHGILTLMAGGRASMETREMLRAPSIAVPCNVAGRIFFLPSSIQPGASRVARPPVRPHLLRR